MQVLVGAGVTALAPVLADRVATDVALGQGVVTGTVACHRN